MEENEEGRESLPSGSGGPAEGGGEACPGKNGAGEPDKKTRGRVYVKEDYKTALLLFAAAWVYVRGGGIFGGMRLPLFTFLFAFTGAYRFRAGKRRAGAPEAMTAGAVTGLCCLLLGGIWFLIKYIPGLGDWERQGIMPYMGLFLHGMGVYWILALGGARIRGRLDESAALDLGRGLFFLPMMYFYIPFSMAVSLVKRFKGGKARLAPEKRAKILQGAFGLLMSIPFLLILIPLLSAADESFERFLYTLGSGWQNLGDALIGEIGVWNMLQNGFVCIVACYLSGLFYAAFHPKAAAGQTGREGMEEFRLPAPFLLCFCGAICGLYLLFFAVKGIDLAQKAFAGPGHFVYSQYARQGFFELQWIAAINFALFWFVRAFQPDERLAFKKLLSLLAAETMLMTVLAFAKIVLYIGVYGFTFLRVFSSWFLIVLFVLFCRLLVCVWKKGNAVGPAAVFAAVSFMLLAYSNMNAWMAIANQIMEVERL